MKLKHEYWDENDLDYNLRDKKHYIIHNRRVNILRLIIDEPGKYSEIDLELKFDVGSSTIRRDMQWFRKCGIEIYSRNNAFTCFNMVRVEDKYKLTYAE